MKSNRIPSLLRHSNLFLASIALTVLTIAAGYKAVGDDSIAASPKVQQMLNERQASKAATVSTARAVACPKCADVRTTQANRQAKGAEVLAGNAVKTVMQYMCTACETKLAMAGEGKARHTVASHKCSADAPNRATCCAAN